MSKEAILRAALAKALSQNRDILDCLVMNRPEDARIWVQDQRKVLHKALTEGEE